MDNEKLIQAATRVVNPVTDSHGRLHGDVGAVVLGKNGKTYLGVCVDTPSWGLCAERSALASMVTDGEYEIVKIVAVWQDETTGKLHVLPPCGICREFMRSLHKKNLEADIILGKTESKKLYELIPNHEWPSPLE